jgi:beta-glucosidase
LQGGGPAERLRDGHVFATLKHMTGHGQPEGGNNVAPAQLAERELRENFFPPFRDAIRRAGAAAVMPSYNEIDGVPSHANTWLLGTILRGEWGFDGLIVSDYGALLDMVRLHHVADDAAHAGRLALAAGVDSDLPEGDGYQSLAQQVRSGLVDEALVNQSAARMLSLKFRAGLFENPYGDARLAQRLTGNAEARALALEAARKSLCLLKNDGALPLDRSGIRRLAVIGPNAAIARLGGYSSIPRQSVSLLDGIRAVAGRAIDIVHAQGVFITRSEDRSANLVELADPARNRALIAEAVELARDCDAIILAIGDTEQTSREGFAANHLGDRTDVDIVGEQNALVAAMAALGKPLIICAINGRPPSWPAVVDHASALIECWYPGQEGGTAMAEALFGLVNPGAKLPVSVVRNAGQIPLFYNRKPTSRRGYLFEDAGPLFPFGHGLSYTRFTVGAPVPERNEIRAGQGLFVSVDVANIGDRAGDEVVQLYIRRRSGSVTSPLLALKGFRRVTLQPGERQTLRFDLPGDAFALWNRAMREVVEPGAIDLLAGPSSAELTSTRITII